MQVFDMSSRHPHEGQGYITLRGLRRVKGEYKGWCTNDSLQKTTHYSGFQRVIQNYTEGYMILYSN